MRLGVLDLCGGSLERAAGLDERPAVGESPPLGAGRLDERPAPVAGTTFRSLARLTGPAPSGAAVLREGAIPRKLDAFDGTAQIDRSAQDAPDGLGRLTSFEARCTG